MTQDEKQKIYKAGYEFLKSDNKAQFLAYIIEELILLPIFIFCIYGMIKQEKLFGYILATVLIVLACCMLYYTIKLAVNYKELDKGYFEAVDDGELNIVLNIDGCCICFDNDSTLIKMSLDDVAKALGFEDPTDDPNDGKTKLLQLIADETKSTDIKI